MVVAPYPRHLNDVFDDIRLEKLDAAHFDHEEHPHEVDELIADFVGSPNRKGYSRYAIPWLFAGT